MKVLKFGGTSVGSAQRMKNVAKLITGECNIIVLSAMSLLILEFALPLYNMYIHIYRKFRGKIDYTSRI